MNNVKQANINIHLKELFIRWLDITSAFHNLTKQQKQVLGLFLYYHYKYQKDITNNKILWKVVFDYDTRQEIKNELGIKDAVLQNILSKFRKDGIIKGGKIISTFIPELEQNSNNFKIIFNFNIINE
jgi:hypothetical protein